LGNTKVSEKPADFITHNAIWNILASGLVGSLVSLITTKRRVAKFSAKRNFDKSPISQSDSYIYSSRCVL